MRAVAEHTTSSLRRPTCIAVSPVGAHHTGALMRGNTNSFAWGHLDSNVPGEVQTRISIGEFDGAKRYALRGSRLVNSTLLKLGSLGICLRRIADHISSLPR